MSIQAERLMVEVQADVRDALRKLDQVERRSVTMGERVSRVGKSMGMAFGGAALVGGIGKSIKLAMDFDQTIRQVGVQTDTSGAKLQSLSKLALQVGKDTIYSAKDAGDAMLNLAKGGLTAAQIKAGALDTTMQLAAAGGLDLSKSADAVVSGLNTFGLKGKQASQIATALAGAANASAADVSDLTMSLAQAGAGASAAGLSIQETSAALGIFANNGVKGSDAGTSLKTMLQRLTPITQNQWGEMQKLGLSFKDGHGHFVGLEQIAGRLHKTLGGLSQVQRQEALNTIFGSDASRAALFLYKAGAGGVRKMMLATRDHTKVQKMANTTMQGAKGAWENFKGSVETAAIMVGQKLLPMFTKAANKGADFIGQASTWGPQIKSTFSWVGPLGQEVVGVVKPAAAVVLGLAKAFNALPGPVKSAAVELGAFALIWPKLAGAGGGLVKGFTNLGPIKAYRTATESVTTAQGALRAATAEVTTAQAAQSAAALRARDAQSALISSTAKRGELTNYVQANQALAAAQGKASVAADELAAAQRGRLTASLRAAGGAVRGLAGPAGMLLLVSGAQQSNKAVGAMMDTLGGAAAGFAAGGPIGAAIGGAAGLTLGLVNATKDGGNEATKSMGSWKNYAATLDQVSGATTAATRAMAYQRLEKSGLLKTTRDLGISDREAVAAATSDGAARTHVQAILAAQSATIKAKIEATRQEIATTQQSGKFGTETARATAAAKTKELQARLSNLQAIGTELGAVSKASAAKRREIAATRDFSKAVHTLPKGIVTELKAKVLNMSDVVRLAAQYRLTPKLVSTLIKENGGTPTRKSIEAVIARAKEYARMHPSAILSARDAASAVINAVRNNARSLDGTHSVVSIETRRFTTTGTTHPGGKSFATGGYTGPGGKYQVAGVVHAGEWVSDAETTKRAMPLLQALSATKGRLEGFASGGAVGHKAPSITKKKPPKPVYHGGTSSITNLAESVVKGLAPMKKAVERLQDSIRLNTKGAKEHKLIASTKSYERKFATLLTRQADVAVRLKNATQALEDKRQQKADFVSNTSSGISSQATVLNAGNSAGAIDSSLKVQAAKVTTFATMLTKLKAMGFGEAVVSQVAQAGVEGGYTAAQALIASSATQVKSINSSMASITATATATANQLGSALYDAGIASAAGLVRGLGSESRNVTHAISVLAAQMEAQFRKDLKIKSPSRVTGWIGKMTGEGLWRNMLAEEGNISGAATRLAKAAIPTPGNNSRVSPSSMSGGRGGGQVSFTFITHNPKDEPVSQTTNKGLARVASLGLI